MAIDTTSQNDYLVWNVPIVETNSGWPTPTFIRWFQQFRNSLGSAVTSTRKILTGTGLTGGGDLSQDRTISLADTAVTPGTYGDATHSAKITVDQQGRLIDATQVPISGGGGGGGYTLLDTVVAVGGEFTLEFASIPSGYTHLMIVGQAGCTGSNTGTSAQVSLIFNNDTTGGHYGRTMFGWFNSGSTFGLNTADLFIPEMGVAGISYGAYRIDIPNYTSTGQITYYATSSAIQLNVGIVGSSTGSVWSGPAPITDIKLNMTTPDPYTAGSTFWLYAI